MEEDRLESNERFLFFFNNQLEIWIYAEDVVR